MAPVEEKERLAALDILRGVALFGVLMVNLLGAFRVSLWAHILGTEPAEGAPGSVVAWLVAAAIEFKAFALFSFLFGAGTAMQVGRGAGARFLLRRFLVLAGFGLVHMVLLWNGDILVLYAVCGLALMVLLRAPDWMLGVAGLVLIVAPHYVPLPVPFPDGATMRAQAALAQHAYGQGAFGEMLAYRWRETGLLIVPLLLLSLPKTLGLMLWGAASWRRGLLVGRRGLWKAVLAAGLAVGVAGLTAHVEAAAHVPLALAYAAGILLWVKHAPLVAAAGQMALTNYLAQSVVFGAVFYGYGLGLFGKVGTAEAAAAGVAFYLVQLVASRWWLRRYRFGPCEWLWRSIGYGRRQPMARSAAGRRAGFGS